METAEDRELDILTLAEHYRQGSQAPKENKTLYRMLGIRAASAQGGVNLTLERMLDKTSPHVINDPPVVSLATNTRSARSDLNQE